MVAHAVLDADGRLLSAEPAIDALNRRAGGAIGLPLAVPALATVVRLARRLGIVVSRAAVVADDEGDVELWVRAQPDGDRIRLAASGWRERPGWTPTPAAPDIEKGDGWRWDTDAALRLTRLSIEAGRRHGFDAVALLGQPITALFALDDEDGQLPLVEAFARREPLAEQRARLRDGGVAMILSATVLNDVSGRFGGFAGLATPVAMPTTAAPVPPPLADEFVAGLDRALRRPLAQIIANADSINGATDGPVAPDYADYAADIAHAGRHLLALVEDLVDLQAVERPGFAPVADAIDLADVARRAAGLLAVRASEAGVMIERPLPGVTLWARGDFRRALQILVNLIGNALRYAPRGSIVLVNAHRETGQVAISIADDGKGIAAADQARVFEKFERIDPSEPGGNGLGLYIARRLARAMGGDLTLVSMPGEGARFTLTLPAGPSPANPARGEDQH
ncbi:sensor histidine kinase [Sphingomonas bacterium]|uniref:sensor histidine kinase n=1 Tax=Sphingomonas bacterium TaxID=1895847 RepID=UPI001576C88F|nr:HAMP domain-containing sensor histidine kinase [Sphingomonas bacterium]